MIKDDLEAQLKKEQDKALKNFMELAKHKRETDQGERRFTEEDKLDKDIITEKEAQKASLEAEYATLESTWQGMSELQTALAKEKELTEQIEKDKVII